MCSDLHDCLSKTSTGQPVCRVRQEDCTHCGDAFFGTHDAATRVATRLLGTREGGADSGYFSAMACDRTAGVRGGVGSSATAARTTPAALGDAARSKTTGDAVALVPSTAATTGTTDTADTTGTAATPPPPLQSPPPPPPPSTPAAGGGGTDAAASGDEDDAKGAAGTGEEDDVNRSAGGGEGGVSWEGLAIGVFAGAVVRHLKQGGNIQRAGVFLILS